MKAPRIAAKEAVVREATVEKTFPNWRINWLRFSQRHDGTGMMAQVELFPYNYDTEEVGDTSLAKQFTIGNVNELADTDEDVAAALGTLVAVTAKVVSQLENPPEPEPVEEPEEENPVVPE